jgi:F-type H+-transporting ATPase subunit epsilon
VSLQVELVSPERILYSGRADMVIARTIGGGELAFLTGHAPFVGALDIASVTIRSASEGDQTVAVHGGFIEVSSPPGSSDAGGDAPTTTVTILSDVAELADQIDVERARRAQGKAQERVQQGEDGEAEAAVRRAELRINTAIG